MRVYFFGCWNEPGHYLFEPGGRRPRGGPFDPLGPGTGYLLDGGYAPRRAHPGTVTAADSRGGICWAAMRPADRHRAHRESEECPQGEYLIHQRDGFTLMSWWDRCQGDQRGACNSALLVEGEHDAAIMLAELAARFPHVLANLQRAGVDLREVPRG